VKLLLSRRPSGQYMLTRDLPIRERVRGTHSDDLYFTPGEPIGVNHLCHTVIHALLGGYVPAYFETVPVELTLTMVEPD
jgi:hypothetical protein